MHTHEPKTRGILPGGRAAAAPYRRPRGRVGGELLMRAARRLTERDRVIVCLVARHKGLTTEQLAALFSPTSSCYTLGDPRLGEHPQLGGKSVRAARTGPAADY